MKPLTHLWRLAFDYVEKCVRWFSFLYSIKGKKYNAFLICIMFLFTLFNFLLGCSNLQCTIDESIKGAASQRRYGITFDGNINIKYNIPPVTYVFYIEIYLLKESPPKHFMLSYLQMRKKKSLQCFVAENSILRFHRSKIEFVCLFFGGSFGLKKNHFHFF